MKSSKIYLKNYVEMRRCFVITRLKLSTVATNSWNIKMLITPWFLNEVPLNSIFGFELYRKKRAFLFSFQTYITRNSFKDVQGFSSFIFSECRTPFLPWNFNAFIQWIVHSSLFKFMKLITLDDSCPRNNLQQNDDTKIKYN